MEWIERSRMEWNEREEIRKEKRTKERRNDSMRLNKSKDFIDRAK